MSRVLIACSDVDTQETSKWPMLAQARKMIGVSAKVGGVLQMSMRKKHHFQKILVPAKDNQILLDSNTKKSNHLNPKQKKKNGDAMMMSTKSMHLKSMYSLQCLYISLPESLNKLLFTLFIFKIKKIPDCQNIQGNMSQYTIQYIKQIRVAQKYTRP